LAGTWDQNGVDTASTFTVHDVDGSVSGDGESTAVSLRLDNHFTVTGTSSELVFHSPSGDDSFDRVQVDGDTLTLGKSSAPKFASVYHRR
jgi:hypothetical protein